MAGGYQPLAVYDLCVANLDPTLGCRPGPHDPAELMQLCYGALLTHFSDARFRARLFGGDEPGERFLRSLIEILRAALEPASR